MNLSITHRGTLRVAAAPGHAFQLFTAPGERLWIEDWDPAILNGGDGRHPVRKRRKEFRVHSIQ